MPNIVLYSKPACQGCRLTRMKLDKLGLDYTYRDVTVDDAAFAEVQALGYQALPVVVAGDQHWSGYKPESIDALA